VRSSTFAVRGFVSVCALLGACSTTPFDYSAFLAHPPRSLLVLPPLNESPEAAAPYAFLSAVTRPLAERGYYVFPVAVVDALMRENGLPTPTEMHGVPLSKLREVFGADAVLYATIRRWGVSYVVLSSVAEVEVGMRIVDTATGTELWSGSLVGSQSSSDGGGGLIGAMIGAVVTQVVTDPHSRSIGLTANGLPRVYGSDTHGLPIGPLHPSHDDDRARVLRMQEPAR
jgi:hypothetical protein